MHTNTFWLKFGSLSPAVTVKIRSRSPKPNHLIIMSQCYIHANLVKIHPPVHEMSCKQESVMPTPSLTLMPTGSAPKTILYVPLPFGGGIMTLVRVPYTPPHPPINFHNLNSIQPILLMLWQIIGKMYIERSCNFRKILSHHSKVSKKFYDLLGQSAYMFSLDSYLHFL